LPREFGKTLHAALLRPWQLFPSDRRLGSNSFKINSTCLVSRVTGNCENPLPGKRVNQELRGPKPVCAPACNLSPLGGYL